MKLIDSDKAYELWDQFFAEIQKHDYKTNQQMMDKVWKAWCELPAAYDVDKVVEQIECEYLMCRCKNNEVCTYPETIGCCYDNGIKKAVEIVKSGIIE